MNSEQNSSGQLTLKGIRKKFGDHEALKHIDLEIKQGEFVSLLGPSGCGKTTLLRIIAGFEDATAGAVLLDGEDLAALPPHKRPVNTVFQSYALFPHMSVSENVAYGLRRAKVPKAEIRTRVQEALELVQMTAFADRRPDMLSGGQRQRIALARALVNRPKVLLLDEPMSALDRKLREEMQLELIRLHTDLGMTFVFVTHDQEEALAMSDRIVVLNHGVIQQVGESEDIYREPANSFVASFIGKQNTFAGTVDSVDGERVTISTAEGTIESTHAQAARVEPGQQITAAVRPEVVFFAEQGPRASTEKTNTVTGTIVGESFLGDIVQWLIRTPGGHELLVRGPSFRAPDRHEGDEVTVGWDAVEVQVFDND